jgi:hypothetical protein
VAARPIDPDNPYTRDHYRQMCRTIDSTLRTGKLIERCTSCGLDFSAERAENDAQRQLLMRMQAEFFPAGPPGEGE